MNSQQVLELFIQCLSHWLVKRSLQRYLKFPRQLEISQYSKVNFVLTSTT